MTSYSPSFTPRRRVARDPSFSYDRSVSQIATATDGGPSRLPEISQLVDMNFDEISASEASEHPNAFTTVSAPSTSNHAEKLRALLRLPSKQNNTSPPDINSQPYLSERESDYDMDLTEPANAAPSMVQESLKDIFSKARRSPGDTPQKIRHSRSGEDSDTSELDSKSKSYASNVRDISNGKRRSLSDDGTETPYAIPQRPATRFKHSPQPVTKEFLRERFSESRILPEPPEDDEAQSTRDHSNDAGATSGEMNSFQTNLPVATSTPQQSLRMSFNSQFRSNLLDQDTEMQHAIDDLVSDGEFLPNQSMSPPPILRKRPSSRTSLLAPTSPDFMEDNSKTPMPNRAPYSSSYLSVRADDRTQSRYPEEPNHTRKFELESFDEPTPRRDNFGPFSAQLPTPSKDYKFRLDTRSDRNNNSASSAMPSSPSHANTYRPRSRSPSPIGSHRSEVLDVAPESQRQWDSPHPQASHTTHSRLLQPPTSPLSRSSHSSLKGDNSRSFNKSADETHVSSRYSMQSDGSNDSNIEGNDINNQSSFSQSSLKSKYRLNGTSSLQSINNTYQHTDPSLRRPARTPSPSYQSTVPSTIKKSRISTSSTTKQSASPFDDWGTPHSDLAGNSTPIPKNKQFIQRSGTPDLGASHDPGSAEDELLSTTSPGHIPHLGATNTPRILVEDQTPAFDSFEDDSHSSRRIRQTPKAMQMESRSPSPVDDLPELPVLSDDDKSDFHKSWNIAETPRQNGNGHQEPSWLPTPKPPGGWFQTPVAPRFPSRQPGRKSSQSPVMATNENTKSDEGELIEPATPAKSMNTNEDRYATKTPRPPGGWQTPAPTISKTQFDPLSKEQTQNLATPVSSLSKGSFHDPKTPYVPGGWAATPAARKAALKVRFDHETEAPSAEAARIHGHQNDKHFETRTTKEDSPPRTSPLHNSRGAHTSNVRILDAFGREEASEIEEKYERHGSDIPDVVESTGRKAQHAGQTNQEQTDNDDNGLHPPSRAELLSRIRRGFDDLVEDIDELESDDDAPSDRSRIEELHALSRQAREKRERLLQTANNQAKHKPASSFIMPPAPFDSKSTHSRNKRIYIILFFLQILLVLLMYRFSVLRAKALFLNSYYDPFNPELYLYIFKHDTSFQLMNADFSKAVPQPIGQALLEEGRRAWYVWLHFVADMYSYFWTFLGNDVAARVTTWSPT